MDQYIAVRLDDLIGSEARAIIRVYSLVTTLVDQLKDNQDVLPENLYDDLVVVARALPILISGSKYTVEELNEMTDEMNAENMNIHRLSIMAEGPPQA